VSRLIVSSALIVALLLDAAFPADADGARRRHRAVLAPVPAPIVAPNWPPDLELGPSGGNFFTRDNGHFNSMSNDFGTSGVLGHTNGLPAGGSTFIYH
jgi:hypothetical protein